MSIERRESSPGSGFDKLSRVYRWMEYLSFGPYLWRTRAAFLPYMLSAQRALVLGDGDGRFTAALFRTNAEVRVFAVDASRNMLRQLQRRVARQGHTDRLRIMQGDVTRQLPSSAFDLICTHFFLDCLTEAECECLIRKASASALPGSLWIVSEFEVPQGLLQVPARLLIAALYKAFRLLTGLQVQCLPDYRRTLLACGWQCLHQHSLLGGILRAEVWQSHMDSLHPKDHVS